ncbi:MAG: fasciclin domain-containing protein [Chloroflexota bacterium]
MFKFNKLKMFAVLSAVLLLSSISTAWAVNTTSRDDLPTIAGIASSNDSFDTLVSALSQAGLVDAVNSTTGDKLTVFAPTDEAFAKLPSATLNAVLADRDLLQSVLLYHVVSGDVGADTAKTLSSATTLNGEDVRIKVFEGDVYLNDDSKVTGADVIASNGRIHIIDTVLIPPSVAAAAETAAASSDSSSSDTARADFQNIAEIASTNGSFDTLVTAASVAGLVPALADESGFITVFAPTDAAFAKLPAATLNSLLANPTQLANVLLYHVVSGDVGSETAKTLSSAATLSGESIDIKVFEGDIYLNDDSLVTSADIIASNGRIHVIDTVLIPPSIAGATADDSSSSDASSSSSSTRADLPNIAEIASSNGSFDTLVTAASVAGLVPALADESGFITVFAPTDEAFAKLPAATLNSLLANPAALQEVLLYHVVSGDVGSDIAATLSTATMLNGEDVRIKVFKDDIYLNDNSKVTTANILASNGKIHVIDTVLIPPSMASE